MQYKINDVVWVRGIPEVMRPGIITGIKQKEGKTTYDVDFAIKDEWYVEELEELSLVPYIPRDVIIENAIGCLCGNNK